MVISDLSRREFLGLGMGILVASSQAKAFVPKPRARHKVLILGAGMAGLAAARVLQDSKSCQVLVLEARERVGGRIHTSRESGELQEMGAAWIHGEAGNPLPDLCRQYGLSTSPADNWSGIVTYDKNGLLPVERRAEHEKIYQDILDRLRNRQKEFAEKDISLRAALDGELEAISNPEEKKFLEHLFKVNIEDDYGTDLENISFVSWKAEVSYENPDLIVDRGYSALIDKIAEGIQIELNSPVVSIDYSESEVRVKTRDGRIHKADQVIVTIPLGVLKAGSVRFFPELPAWKKEAIARVGFGSFNKIFLTYAKKFWPASASWIECISDSRVSVRSFFNLNKFGGDQTLVGLASGRTSDHLQNLDNPEAVRWVSRSLRNLKVKGFQLVRVKVSRWSKDPYALGSYSYPAIDETTTHREQLGASVGERLHFAGEACQNDYYGTVHGAWLSGQRLGQKMVKNLPVF